MTHDPRTRFGYHLANVARQWRRRLDLELARSGLTDASWAPLFHLSEGGDDISQSELAERVGLDGSSLVRLIDLLESRSLVERRTDPQDRRARRICLTPAGRSEIAAIDARIQEVETALLADIADHELAQFDAALSQIQTRLSAATAAAKAAAKLATDTEADAAVGAKADGAQSAVREVSPC